jgi:hypothetical protein
MLSLGGLKEEEEEEETKIITPTSPIQTENEHENPP